MPTWATWDLLLLPLDSGPYVLVIAWARVPHVGYVPRALNHYSAKNLSVA